MPLPQQGSQQGPPQQKGQLIQGPKTAEKVLAEKQAALPLQPIALTTPFIPPQCQNYLQDFMKNFYTPFIYKDYNINIGGPNANHITASMVYEDAMPPADVYTSYKTLKERNGLCNYARGTFITIDEGEFVDFSGGKNSLNSRLKLLQLNPFNVNYNNSNPYNGLAKNLLIYSSCYPIVYDSKSSLVKCNSSSVGINIRVYRITREEYLAKYPGSGRNIYDPNVTSIRVDVGKIGILPVEVTAVDKTIDLFKTIDKKEQEKEEEKEKERKIPNNFDIWRDVIYYDFIREHINKSSICPNFVQSYCYFMNKDANFNYDKNGLKIKDKTTNKPPIKESNNINMALILLTESPTYHIYRWASNVYVQHKNIQKQTYSGYKPSNVWESIIFQMLIVFYVMDKKVFTFNTMQIDRNFYVKDVSAQTNVNQFWKYRINNIDYYVPNYGYLLLCDNDYHDLDDKVHNKKKHNFKIVGQFLDEKKSTDPDYTAYCTDIRDKVRINAKNCLTSNNFGQGFKDIGGVPPPADIINLLIKIQGMLSNDSITYIDIIQKCFIKYLHNRIGTPIRDTEVEYIRKTDARPFTAGQIVIHEESFGNYKIVLFMQPDDPYNCICVTRASITSEFEFKRIGKDQVYHYSENEIIKQDMIPGEPSLNLDYIIESYIL